VAKAAKQTPVSSNVMARAKAHAESPASKDKLDAVRAKVKEARDIDFSIQSLNERLSLLSKRKQELVHNELPDLFQDAKIDVLGIEPEGNMPGYDTELKDFYHANIPEARRDEAFAWLDKNRKLEVSYSSKLSVPWNTLTAFVKEQVEKGAVLPLDILGATVGRVVKLKARKD
jgi:hypothetical protein